MVVEDYRKSVHCADLLAEEEEGNKTVQKMTGFDAETTKYKQLSGMTPRCRCSQEEDRELQASCKLVDKQIPEWFQPLRCSICWDSGPIAAVNGSDTHQDCEPATLTKAERTKVKPESLKLDKIEQPKKPRIEEATPDISNIASDTPKSQSSEGNTEANSDVLTPNYHSVIGDSHEQRTFWSREFDHVRLVDELPFLHREKLNFEVRGKKITVGSGSFGTVRLGEYIFEKGPLVVAIKELKSDLGGANRRSCLYDLYKEGQVLHHLQHTGVTPQFHGFLVDHHTMSVSLVEEYVGHTKTLLQVLLDGPGVFDKAQWRHICLCLVAGLARIHESGVLINDIKLDNVLVELGKGRSLPKVTFIDFGNATYKRGGHFGFPPGQDPGDTCFPPEVARENQRTSPSSDVYSMGLVLEAICYCARVGNVKEAVDACLAENPKDRPTALQLLHLIFSSFHQNSV